MKSENHFSRAFIDLAKMGRTDWRSIVLTLLLVQFLYILAGSIALLTLIYLTDRFCHIPSADEDVVYRVAAATAYILALWLACKKILQRSFRSLISTDMTFDIRRCLLGAALYLAAYAVSFMAIALFTSVRAGAWVVTPRHFEWPHHNDQIVASIGMLVVIPFLAFSEELFFRGWLTQTIGRYVRSPIIVVTFVAVIFAAYHSQYDLRLKTLILASSFGLSALSLRDQRLELAIGAHSMMNVCATLNRLFLTGSPPHVHIPETTLDLCALLILHEVLPVALVYGFLQKTGGWFVPPIELPLTEKSH
jgi:uncharacterized protein